jgi:hypothetical protein
VKQKRDLSDASDGLRNAGGFAMSRMSDFSKGSPADRRMDTRSFPSPNQIAVEPLMNGYVFLCSRD